jgi:hypothetical protein
MIGIHTEVFNRVWCTLQAQQLAVGVEGAAAARITGTIDSLMSKLQTLGAGHPPSPVRQQLMATVNHSSSSSSSSSSRTKSPATSLSEFGNANWASSSGGSSSNITLKHMFAEFAAKYQQQLENEAKAPVSNDYSMLPCR